MEKITEYHHFLFNKKGDERVYDWPLMSSPWITIGIIVLYLFMIYKFLPSFMSKRKPYSLKELIIIYNAVQIVVNAVIAYSVTSYAWNGNYTLRCQLIDHSNTGPALKMAEWYWWCLLVKIFDLLETIFFTLRKKFRQISVFHVCHHSTTILTMWCLTKYVPGGMSFLCLSLNTAIHTIMYTYYLLSSLGPNIQKKMMFFKPIVTLMQMAHLFILTIYVVQPLFPGCKYSRALPLSVFPATVMNLTFFYNFFKHTYIKKKNN
ncbi:hypothetical protein ILUMI_11709 [Ignelater luminosus]|uniref:Elongation of very long chain fatty acids protein n=1 Tax=Ignelater luminosus TaxID=2038154 RepID=A0A8K0G7G5_IGNLU|nr:hypothetical protein ILUMI_11709 [Ignelater luminosus]